MTWLRRQQDIASLFAVWALLFQVLLGPFAMAGHAFGATQPRRHHLHDSQPGQPGSYAAKANQA